MHEANPRVSELRLPDLKPEVQSYIAKLKKSLFVIYAKYEVKNRIELAAKVREGKVDKKDSDRAIELLTVINEYGRKNELPAGSMQRAREIIGEVRFLGPEAISHAFGIELDPAEIPPIPFSDADLERAKKEGDFLILRTDATNSGEPLTVDRMHDMAAARSRLAGLFKVNFLPKPDENYFYKEVPKMRWALVSKFTLSGTLGCNYFDQTKILVENVKNNVFRGQSIPRAYQEAIDEFEREKDSFASIMTNNWVQAADRLSALKINQMCRRTAVEVVYDLLCHYAYTNHALLLRYSDWTNSQRSEHGLIGVGYDGIQLTAWTPSADGAIGVVFSRTQ